MCKHVTCQEIRLKCAEASAVYRVYSEAARTGTARNTALKNKNKYL